MLNLEAYNISFKKLTDKAYIFEYELNNLFFNLLDDVEITEGDLDAKVRIVNSQGFYNLEIAIDGFVFVPCDRCLDDMRQAVTGSSEFLVKFGKATEEADDTIYISEESGMLNIAWLMYETIALHIPMIHTHSEDECNEEMLNKLYEHITYELDEDEDENDKEVNNRKTDPRWEGLKNIITN